MPVCQRESREAVSLRLRYPRAGNRVLVTGLVTVATPACKVRPRCRGPWATWASASPPVLSRPARLGCRCGQKLRSARLTVLAVTGGPEDTPGVSMRVAYLRRWAERGRRRIVESGLVGVGRGCQVANLLRLATRRLPLHRDRRRRLPRRAGDHRELATSAIRQALRRTCHCRATRWKFVAPHARLQQWPAG